MKKTVQRLSVILLLAGIAMPSIAQEQVKVKGERAHEIPTSQDPTSNVKNKAAYANWKFPVDAISQLTTLDRFVGFLFEDSIVKYVPATGDPYFQPTHAVGAAFTPNDPNLALVDDNIILSRYNAYTVDSIYFPYLYVRNLDSVDLGSGNVKVVDTLIVQFFKFANLAQGSFNTADPEIFMKNSNFTKSIGGANNAAFTMRIPLTDADSTALPTSTGWGSKGRVVPLPADFNIDSDHAGANLGFRNTFGFMISFKTMVRFSYGDTMEARNGATIAKKLNYFGHSLYSNSSVQIPQKDYINNSWWVGSEHLYGQPNPQNWTNSVPGNAYFDDQYLNYGVHIATQTLGTNELNDNLTFGVYPNPISSNEKLMADFRLKNASDVEIGIYDLLGNKVLDVVNGLYAGGEHKIDANIAGLTPGMYIYTVKAGNAVTSKKISVVE
jgi:hypothetical protein